MARVLITRPNASDNNNGLAFEPYEGGGMISEEIDAVDALKLFPIGMSGYELVESEEKPKPAKKAGKDTKSAKEETQPVDAKPVEGGEAQGSLEVGGNGD